MYTKQRLLILIALIGISFFYLTDRNIVQVEAAPNAFTDCNSIDTTTMPTSECDALVAIYNQMDGPNWSNNNKWLQDANPCQWAGVTCQGGNPIRLDFSGTSSSERFGLVGDIPPEIGDFPSLTRLSLNWNQISALPAEIGQLSNLQILEVNGNQLTALPTAVNTLFSLQQLRLNDNEFSTFPMEVAGISSLTQLWLNNNELSTIPTGVGAFSNLRYLGLASNHLRELPMEIGNLSSLKILDISENQLVALPLEIGQLSALEKLNLVGNQLSTLPYEVANLSNLLEIDLAHNRLDLSSSLLAFADLQDSGWMSTQTIPPSGLVSSLQPDNTVMLEWLPIDYISDGGFYEISFATSANGLYQVHGQTSSKSNNTYDLIGLNDGTTYHMRIRSYTPAHASNPNELWSRYSTFVSATTLEIIPPIMPTRTSLVGGYTPTPTPKAMNTAIPTPTSTDTVTSVATPTGTETLTPSETATATSSVTLIPTETATYTPIPTNTSTSTDTATSTATPTETETLTPTETPLPIWTSTATPMPGDTWTSTATPMPANTWTHTITPMPPDTWTPTVTHTPTVTSTPTPTMTSTETPIATVTPIPTCYKLILSQIGEGALPIASSASVDCPVNRYLAGEYIELSAQPAVGWTIEGWRGTDNNSQQANVNSLTMPAADREVTAIYSNIPIESIEPLKVNCRGITPPGETEPTACIIGMVYAHGLPRSNAQVEIISEAGKSKAGSTEMWNSSLEKRPYYYFDLGSDSLRIEAGQPFTVQVSYGGITKTVTTVAQSGRQQIDIVFLSTVIDYPIATINYLSDKNLVVGDTLTAYGTGQIQRVTDENESTANKIVAYRWKSDVDGILGESATLVQPVSELSPGTHILRFQVQDSLGTWSPPVLDEIYVSRQPQVDWVMLLYLTGDYTDNDKQWQVFQDVLDELKNVENPLLRIVAQVDGYDRDAQRWVIDPTRGVSEAVQQESLGEVAMDDPETLIDFLKWGQQLYPAEYYHLVIAGHGQGARGIAWDTTSDWGDDGKRNDSAYLTIKELGQALNHPEVAPVDILHLDACSMNMVEVAYEIGSRTQVLIASQYLAWDYFAYDRHIEAIKGDTDPQALGRSIVESYGDMAQEGANRPYTLSALDMRYLNNVMEVVDELATELAPRVRSGEIQLELLETIRIGSQSFDSQGNFSNDEDDLYIDLAHWVTRLQDEIDIPAIQEEAEMLTMALENFVLTNEHQSGRHGGVDVALDDATGISIFYPPSPYHATHQRYINHEQFNFTRNSRWSSFLNAAIGMQLQPDVQLTPEIYPLSSLGIILPMPTRTALVGGDTPTPTPKIIHTATPNPTPTFSPTNTPIATNTSKAISTPTPTPSATSTPTPTNTPITEPISVLDIHCHEALPSVGTQQPHCVVGLVYINGQPADDITVQIQSQDGRADTTQTRIRLGREKRPYYSLDLGKLKIDKGDSFEVIVEYGGQSYKVEYIAQPRLQQLDIAIPSVDQSRPIANIRHHSSYILYAGETLILDGIGLSGITDITITGYRWFSNRQEGELGNGSTLELPADKLKSGKHTISFQAQDSRGNWSASTETTLYVDIRNIADWTILLYLSADFHNSDMDETFHKTLVAMADAFELSDTGSIQIAAQIDGPKDGDTKRWLIQNEKGFVEVPAFCGEIQCEAATDDPDSLVEFIRWAQLRAPAKRYYLVIADHGQGIQGTAWDTTSDLADNGTLDNSAYLTVRELGDALDHPDIEPINILHLDACSMNLLETAFELQTHVDVLLSSQYLAWSYFAYDQYLPLFRDSRQTPQKIAKKILEHYATWADGERYPYTISALNMKQASDVFATVDEFSDELLRLITDGKIDPQTFTDVRSEVLTFDSNGNDINDQNDYYVDLMGWTADLLNKLDNQKLKQLVAELTLQLTYFVIDSESGSYPLYSAHVDGDYIDLKEASGISIFYPMNYNSIAYQNYIEDQLFSFTAQSPWPKFLQAIGGTVQSAASAELEPFPGPLGHLETQPPKTIYLPVIMR